MNKTIKTIVLCAALVMVPQISNATCYGGCNIPGPQGPPGIDGIDGLSIVGPQGPAGTNGLDGLNGVDGQSFAGRDGRSGMAGLSLIAATTSFEGSGIGAGISSGNGILEVSIGAGIQLDKNIKFIGGYTHDKYRDRVTAGIGFSF